MSPSVSPLAWSRDRGLVAIAVVAVLGGAVFGLELVPDPALGVVRSGTLLAVNSWTAVLARTVVARYAPTSPATARFWRFVTAAAVAFAAATAVGLATAGNEDASASIRAVLLAAGVLCLVAGMIATPLGIADRRARVRFWLDAATVLVGVGTVAWLLTESARASADAGLVRPLIGPLALMAVAFGVVKISLGGTTPMTRLAAGFGLLAALLQCLSASLGAAMTQDWHPSWRTGLALFTALAFAAGTRAQLRASTSTGGSVRGRASGRSYSRLPYVAAAAGYALLIWVLAEQAQVSLRAWVVLGGAIVSSALVVVRQLAAFADNDDLLTRLNTNLRELAAAKEVLQRAVDERDALAGRLRHLAYHDELTGLANRALFLERLTGTLAARQPGEAPTVVMIDLDDFKPVNDRYGHRAGDALLRAVAGRLLGCVRDADLVARLGGDEFAILLATPGPAEVARLVRRVGEAVCRPVRVGTDATEVRVRASIGTATAAALRDPPGDIAAELTALLHNADLEMYADKQLGKPVS